jgi:hypothetical protein
MVGEDLVVTIMHRPYALAGGRGQRVSGPNEPVGAGGMCSILCWGTGVDGAPGATVPTSQR